MSGWALGPKDHRLSPRYCPYCGAKADAARRAAEQGDPHMRDDEPPAPGNIAICFTCARPGVYTETGIRIPDEAEKAELAADPVVQHMIGAMLAYRLGAVRLPS